MIQGSREEESCESIMRIVGKLFCDGQFTIEYNLHAYMYMHTYI